MADADRELRDYVRAAVRWAAEAGHLGDGDPVAIADQFETHALEALAKFTVVERDVRPEDVEDG